MNPPATLRRIPHLATFVVALALACTLVPAAATAAPGGRPGAPGAATTAAVSPVVDDRPVELPRPVSGRRAVELLGDQLPAAAHANEMSASRLRNLLLTDPAAVLDGGGRLLYTDPAPTDPAHSEAAHTEAAHTEVAHTEALEGSGTIAAASAPLSETFALHSKPGSARTIFLDFDGTDVSSTYWNSQFGVAAGWHGGWDPTGDGAGFSDAERTRIQSVWARVAEDFAPFDVDVTTEDPGAARITRSGTSDQVFGTRVLITTTTQASGAICSSGCGGVAYMDVFDEPAYHAQLQPAWVFSRSLGNDTKSIAEAATHEAGHNLSLDHDATTSTSYYAGHGGWAPIMGVGYDRPLVQWSRGGYTGADNTEDDLALIAASGAPVRADEAGSTVGTAAGALPTGPAYVTSDADQDVYALGTCRGAVSIAAQPASVSPNLDVSLRLLDAEGAVVATANPLSAVVDRDRMSGLSATVRADLVSGSYYVRVDGTGNGTATTGYDGYGSIGAYRLSATGCGDTAAAPGATGDVAASAGADGRSATLTWSAPTTDGGSPITGYVVSRDGTTVTTVAATARSYAVTGLTPGTTPTLAVAAVNGAGPGPASSVRVILPGTPPAPEQLTVATRSGVATVRWQAPASYDVALVTGWQVRALRSGVPVAVSILPAGARSWSYQLPKHTSTVLEVALVSGHLLGQAARTGAVRATTKPSAPRISRVRVDGRDDARATAVVAWRAPASTGGAPVQHYRVVGRRVTPTAQVLQRRAWSVPGSQQRLWMLLPSSGRWLFTVRATNKVGTGPASALSKPVLAR